MKLKEMEWASYGEIIKLIRANVFVIPSGQTELSREQEWILRSGLASAEGFSVGLVLHRYLLV